MKDNQDTISYPIELCGPLNADFDGDTVSFTLVPEEVKEDTFDKMSPRYSKLYKKSLQPIFGFTLETLNGGNVATQYVYSSMNELKDPKYFYDDYAKLLEDVTVNEKIKIGTPIVFTGECGGVKYQSKVTSYGRLRTSKIINADIDKIGIFDNPYEPLRAKSATKLVLYLYQFKDFVEKMNALQKFWLKCVTKAGVVTFDFKTLFVNTNTKTYKNICDIADAKDLTDQQKLLLMTDEYNKYEKEIEKEFSDDIKNELSRAGKIKLASIMDINMPQFIVSGVDEKPYITRSGSLLSGYSEKDMIYHSIENRSLQSIKNSGVD